ncbi:FliI/YscN family ATPase [Ascidiaceihabitans sp.]|uniref:FliI/YscN family ATPase n=1 Tax=Ascidiaceihabitans sp. TaxID=1872644 RepID=UPI003298603E
MNNEKNVSALRGQLAKISAIRTVGRVDAVEGGVVVVSGLESDARIGDRVTIIRHDEASLSGEVVQLSSNLVTVLPDGPVEGVALGNKAMVHGAATISPCNDWIGRIVDPDGRPLDNLPLPEGGVPSPLKAPPPAAGQRRPMGERLATGLAVFDTMLPIVRGQRIGLFAGSGVGKSSLLGSLAQNMEADVVVVAMIGERGREVRHFVETVLGSEGLARSVIVAATSDQSPLLRRRCAWSAMAVAEYFRDQGKSVLFLADSITRFAEAHREVAVAAGEAPVLRGYPPSTAHMIMSLCERSGTGGPAQGDITAVFSVLVAGSDMDEPIADILRGVLDGHVVLDRAIAERGRYPAVDVLRSVSRSLPAAATDQENNLLGRTRRILGTYAKNEMMISSGLYAHGADPEIDAAIQAWPDLDEFLASSTPKGVRNGFDQLGLILRRVKTVPRPTTHA